MKNKLYYTSILILFLTACVGEDFVEVSNFFDAELSITTGSTNSPDTLAVGEQTKYEARFRNTQGDFETVGLSWLSSRPEIATIEEATGEITAIAAGVTVISVQYEGVKAERVLVVEQKERVEISSTKSAAMINENIQFAANYYNQQGVQSTATFTWASSDDGVATINNNGLLTTLSEGQTVIQATANGLQSNAIAIVVEDDTTVVASISISAATNSINVGDDLQFSAELRNVNGNLLTGKPIDWVSDNSAVLSIDNNGLASGVSTGSSKVSAISENVSSQELNVIVNQAVTTSRMGTFQGRGSYNVSGTVTMAVQQNGDLQLDFSNFSSSSGPGLYIYLSNSTSGGLDVGKLPTTNGNFQVTLPSNISINDYNYVLIWCKPFGVTFGSALLN